MKNNSDNFKLSKSSFKTIRKAQWNNLEELILCTHLLNLVDCNLNDEKVKTIIKCTFCSARILKLGSSSLFDKSLEILLS